MQPRARAARPPLPPGRLKWATAASAGPERSAARRARPKLELPHGGSLWTASVFRWGFRGPQGSSPGASRFSPQSSAQHGPRQSLCRSCRGPGNWPKNPLWPLLSRWEAWPRFGLSPNPPPKKKSQF
ncbi:hypothetical protein NN561_000238 [Cricetulus griseus]